MSLPYSYVSVCTLQTLTSEPILLVWDLLLKAEKSLLFLLSTTSYSTGSVSG